MVQSFDQNRIYLIGNPTRDRIVSETIVEKTLGGTVLYAGLFLARSGFPVSVVGKGDREMLAWMRSRGIDTDHFTLSNRITTFENRYGPEGRRQSARPGSKIRINEVPKSVFRARAALVGAVMGEVDPQVLQLPRSGIMMLDAQGFLRHPGSRDQVILRADDLLKAAVEGCDILKTDASEAEVITGTGDNRESALLLHQTGANIVIVTMAAEGCGIYDGRRWIRIRAPSLQAVDSTGAGDVFDAAFLAAYLQNGDALEAGCFAASAAALSVTGIGTAAVPSAKEAREVMASYYRSQRLVTIQRMSR